MGKRNLKVDDLFELTSVTNPQLSPDGKEAVFIQTHIDEEENKYVANLFHVELETSEVTQWTSRKRQSFFTVLVIRWEANCFFVEP